MITTSQTRYWEIGYYFILVCLLNKVLDLQLTKPIHIQVYTQEEGKAVEVSS